MIKNKETGIYGKIVDFDNYVRKYILSNVPNIYKNDKIHLSDEIYYLIKNMFYATYNKGNIRMKYLVELKVNISLIDMLLGNINSYNCVGNKYINTAISKLNDVKNIVYGWIINEEKKKN